MDKTLATLTYEFRRLSEKKPNEIVNEFILRHRRKPERNRQLPVLGVSGSIAGFIS